jgi:hypothetical protein
MKFFLSASTPDRYDPSELRRYGQPTTAPGSDQTKATSIRSHRFLPRIGSPGYHILLGAVAIPILGPLGGISAAYMNFSIGFFIGGQVLAGILGSAVTLPYGPG